MPTLVAGSLHVNGFIVLKLLSHLMLPPASLALGWLVGAVVGLGGFRRVGLAIALLSALETLVLSVPPVSAALVAPLQQYARAEGARALPCCYLAIVVLGGGGNDSSVLHGAHLYKTGIADRIIVSGGDLAADAGSTKSEAQYMKHLLVLLGVPAKAVTVEGASRNTAENVANVREIIGDEPVALVTQAYHMKRAMQLARRGALKAYAFPTDFAPAAGQQPVWDSWLPTIEALRVSVASLWEYLGITFDFRAVKPTPTVSGNDQRSASSTSDAQSDDPGPRLITGLIPLQ